MWFRNVQLFRLPANWDLHLSELEERLSRQTLSPCSASEAHSIGWVPSCADGALVRLVNRQWLIALGIEQRLLPVSIIKQHTGERARAIEENEGRRIGRREARELREAITQELLPRAFIRKHSTYGWIDPVNGWLVIDAAAPAKADELIEHLHKSMDGLPLKPIKVARSPVSAMTGWLATGEAPSGFSIDQDLELRSAENAIVRYARHALDGDDITQHIATGKSVTRLAMTWGDKISFLLDEKLQLKRLAFLDILKEETEGQAENEEERFDLDFTLMTGELACLFDDLLDALGGEI